METLKQRAATKVIQTHQLPDDLIQYLNDISYVYIPLIFCNWGNNTIKSFGFCCVIFSSLEKAEERIKILTNNDEKILIKYIKYPLNPKYQMNKVWVILKESVPIFVTNDENLYKENKQLIGLNDSRVIMDLCNEGCYEIDKEDLFST